MAKTIATELAKTNLVTKDGVVTATSVDRLSVDRLYMMLVKGAAAAKYANVNDDTPVVDRSLKDLVIEPTPED